MLVIICPKHGKNPSWTVGATGRTRKVNGQTDGQTDRQTGWIQYTPPNFVAGGYNNIIQILLWMGFITAYNKQGPCHATDALSSCLPRISVAIGLICGIGRSLPPMRKYFNCLCNYKFEEWNELPKMYIHMLKTISYLKGQWISSCYLIKYVVLPLIATDIPAPTTGGY